MHNRQDVHRSIQKYINHKNRTHYLKWTIDNEFSIRYFFVFDDKPEYKSKFILKSHKTKEYIILNRIEAVDFIQSESIHLEPKEYFSLREKKRYRRTIIDPIHGTSCLVE